MFSSGKPDKPVGPFQAERGAEKEMGRTLSNVGP